MALAIVTHCCSIAWKEHNESISSVSLSFFPATKLPTATSKQVLPGEWPYSTTTASERKEREEATAPTATRSNKRLPIAPLRTEAHMKAV